MEQIPGEKFLLDLSNKDLLMPLDVSVEIRDNQQTQRVEKRLRQEKIKYKKTQVNCIDEVFSLEISDSDPKDNSYVNVQANSSSKSHNYVNVAIDERGSERVNKTNGTYFLCTGIAGTGKTVVLKRFAFEWASMSNKDLERFDLFFLIPLRNVHLEKKIVDILGNGRKCLGYITDDEKPILESILSDEDTAKAVMFAIDGVDEVDLPEHCEIHSMLSGKLYKGCKIIITTRPDMDAIARLQTFQPDVRVHIRGTSKAGIFKYIQTSLVKEGGPAADDAQSVISLCERINYSCI